MKAKRGASVINAYMFRKPNHLRHIELWIGEIINRLRGHELVIEPKSDQLLDSTVLSD